MEIARRGLLLLLLLDSIWGRNVLTLRCIYFEIETQKTRLCIELNNRNPFQNESLNIETHGINQSLIYGATYARNLLMTIYSKRGKVAIKLLTQFANIMYSIRYLIISAFSAVKGNFRLKIV